MENKLDKVHISYKRNDEYNYALYAIEAGLKKKNIPYSLDKYDITYKASIDTYEKEIGAANRVIMFVIPEYFKSIECMFEMTRIFINGNIQQRIFPLVDMREMPRNGDGLSIIKTYWQKEKAKKSLQLKDEPGSSSFLLMELQRIDDIIKTLDDFWIFICRHSTGDFEELVKDDAKLLIEKLEQTLHHTTAHIDDKFLPSTEAKPTTSREINQKGEKAIYIENNIGNITIN